MLVVCQQTVAHFSFKTLIEMFSHPRCKNESLLQTILLGFLNLSKRVNLRVLISSDLGFGTLFVYGLMCRT